MVESVFVEVALWSDEYMLKKATEVFAELNSVVYLHRPSCLVERFEVSNAICAISIAAEEGRHK